MNQVKLEGFIKDKKVVLPLYFLRMYKELNVTIDELVILIYLYNNERQVFNPNVISKELKIDLYEVMQYVSNLADKGLLLLTTVKNESGIMEEVLDLSPLYNKITMKMVEELNEKEEEELNIHHLIELEFNRRLSPLEHDVIDEWERNNFSKELIREAVREASLNGVNNLRYIDKILIEWNKKGIKTPNDIKRNFNESGEVKEVFKYDWLNENEEI